MPPRTGVTHFKGRPTCGCTTVGSVGPAGPRGGGARCRTPPIVNATAPGSSAPTPATRRPRSRTRSTAATWRRARPACRWRSTCPTQTGYDPDDELARGEVGKVGVPVSHLGDMRTLFDGIPLAEANTSMTINATAMWLLALYVAVAEEQGADRAQLAGTTQNDIVKEYLSRGTYVFPPAPCMRLITDMIAWSVHQHPEVEPDQHLQLPPAGGRGDAGAGARVRAVDGDRGARLGAGLRARSPPPSSARSSGASRSSSTPGSASSRRCARCARFARLWDEITRERYGVKDAKAPAPPLRRPGQLAGPHRGAAGEQRPAHRAGDARGDAVPRRPRPRRAAAGLERGPGPAPAVGPAVVAADAAGAGLRDRPAGVRGPVRRLAGSSRRRSPSWSRAPGPRSTASRRWAARSRPSRPAT